MNSNEIVITVVVNGTPTQVTANKHAPLRTVVPLALEQTGNQGQPPENWILNDIDGNRMDLDKKIEDYHFPPQVTLFLSLQAGAGG